MLASVDFLPKFGFEFYPIGCFFTLSWVAITFYAIVRHNLLDLHIILRKGLVYSFLAILIMLLYFFLVLVSEKILQEIVGYKSLLISIPASLIIAIFFIPLKNKVQHFVDLVFYKKSPEEITRENELLHQEVVQTERLKSVATLASGMAHEIKNPLTAIKTFSEYLPEKLEDKEFLKKFSKIVGSEVNRIDHIVNQLLEFAKPAPLALKQIDVHDLISNTLDFLNSRFVKQNIKLETHFCQPTGAQNAEIFLTVDLNQIRQALLNIFINAIEAMPLGGTLTIETSLRYPFFVIQISDTGQGIAANDLKHIFDPFYTKKDTGTGLGLSITQRIIKEHKGRIWAKSTLGNGTTFGIEMRLEEEER